LPGQYQENSGSREADYGIFQLDYSSCDTLKIRLESGLRVAYKQSFSDFLVKISETSSSPPEQDSSLSNAFRVDDFVGAAYLNVSGSLGSWGWQAGLRFEDTYFVARQLSTNETYSFIFPQNLSELDKALFPSVYLSRKLGKKMSYQMNYSRKIARPGYMQLIPFITYADRQLIQIGNPVLAPSFLNIAEINTTYQSELFNFFSGFYFRHEQGAITNVIFPSDLDPSVLISTYANATNQYSGGFESNLRFRLSDRFTANLNTTVFYTDVSLQRDSAFINNRGWSWNAKLMLQYSVNEQWKLQLNGNYEASRIIPQGLILPVEFMDFSISFKAGKKSNLNLTVSDLFNSKRFGTRFESDVLTQETYRRWETRYVRLSYTWQFGEPGKSLFKSRGGGRREPGNQGTEMQEL
jgi:outer membrane receptor protein involved in Fe transport